MKTTKLSLTRSSLVAGLALALLLALPAMATEIFNQTAAGTYVWGTTGYWTGGIPAGGTSDSVQFFTDHTTALGQPTITISSDPATLTLNTLTLEGLGATATAATAVSIGTAANTWTFDGTTPTINLNGLNGTKGLTHTINPKLALNADLTITGSGTATFNLSGVISGSGKAITKSGTSTVALNAANTYSGNTTVSAGVLNLANINAIQNSASVSIASSGATLQFGAAGTFVTPSTISIVGTGSSSTVGPLHFKSTPTLNAALTLGGITTISSFGASAAPTLGGAIGGTGPLTILAQGGGTTHYALWTLNNASTYSGNTVIYNADGIQDVTVKLGIANALPTTTSLNLKAVVAFAVNQYSTLDLNGNNQTLAGLTDTGSSQGNAGSYIAGKRVINSGSLATLTINNSGVDTYGTTGTKTLAGTLGGTDRTGTAANNLALVKTGAGTLTLAGANTYTGSTTVSGGLINLGVAETAGTSGPLGNPSTLANSINLQGGGLQFTANNTYDYTTSGRLQLADGSTGIIDDGGLTVTFANAIGVGAAKTGAFTKQGAGTLNLSTANTYTGDTTISAGTLALGAAGSIASANIIANGTFDVASVSGGYHLTTGKTLSGTGTVTGPITVDSGATLTVGGSSGTTMGTLTVNGGLTLNGTTTLRLNKGGGTTSDKLTWSSGTVTLGGTLNLSSVGTTLAAGDTFTILATGATVSSPSITPAHPNNDASLSWDTSLLNSQGKIGVLAAITGTISAPAAFPTAFTAISGTASAAQSVSVTVSTGSLFSGITATAPTGLEVSSDGINYGSTATLSSTGGTLYARLKSTAAVGAYNALNVVLSNPNATSVNVATTSSGNVVATSPYWTATSSGNWGTTGNWFASTIVSGSGTTADFSQVDITSDTTVHLDTSRTVGNLIFGNTDANPTANWILDNNGSAGNTLTLAGGTPTVTVNNLGTGKSATISAEIDGTSGLTKAGPGTLTLSSANNAYSGGTTVSAGTLALSGSGTLGSTSGALTLSGGTLDLGGETTPTVGAVSVTGAATIQNGTLNGSSFTASVASGTATVSAALAISGNATNSGAGTLALSGAGTDSVSSLKTTAGGLTLNSGTLNVTAIGTPAANGLWIAGGTLTVAGGTLNTSSGYATTGGGGTLAVSSGTCNITGSELLNAYGGAGTTTVSGTGVLNVNILRVTQTSSGALVNLNGGTLQLNSFGYGTGTGTVNFNGGTVQAKTATTTFTAVNTSITYKVQAGGAIFDTTNHNITIGSPLVHDSGGPSLDGGLTKTGNGTLTLSGANTYTGATAINAGKLIGSTAGSSASSTVTVASGATNGLQLAAANGQWTCGGLTYSAGTTYADFDFTATAPSTTVAPLKVSGNLAVNSTVNMIVRSGSSLTAGTAYPLMTWTGSGPANLNGFGTMTLPSEMPGTLTLNTGTKTISVVAGIKVPNLAYTNATGTSRQIAISDLTSAGLASSQGSPTYTITLPSGTSAGGGSVITDGSRILYTPSGSPSSDSFSYTVSDGVASATAMVNITFASVTGAQIDSALIGNDGADHPRFTFHGIPNTTYHVQRATVLSPTPNWTNADSGVTAGANGSYLWTDSQTITSLGGSVFYRISYP